MMIHSLSWLIPLFPLAGFLVTGLSGRRLKAGMAGWIASCAVTVSFVLSAIVFLGMKPGQPAVLVPVVQWITAGTFAASLSFLIDPLSVLMMLVVTGVSALIHVYSLGYMKDDAGIRRYFSYLNLFVFSMLVLVMGDSYLVMFIGWEGVGLCSYLLIGFWFRNQAFSLAARKAFIMNRIGDFGFLLGMFLMFNTFGSLAFGKVFGMAATFVPGSSIMAVMTLLLFVGAVGKSAQIPLHTWLPDAMAGPTPVSALIHAATMVTAGVYMVARSQVLYLLAPFTLEVICVTGLATALFAASVAMFQNDIKKVLAYSTISQLGLMFLGLGAGAVTGAMFHLTTHAFFKALLFLGAGSVIHALGGEQDIRKMGGLQKKLPVTFLLFLAGTLAISGIPPFSGFFSKDEILSQVYQHNRVYWGLAVAASAMTAFYMFRLLFLTFSGSYRYGNHTHLHESPGVMTVPMSVLALLALAGGLLNLPPLFGGHSALAKFLEPASLASVQAVAGESLLHNEELVLMGAAFAVIVVVVFFAWYRFVKLAAVPPDDAVPRPFLTRLVTRKYYLDELYDFLIVRPVGWLSLKFQSVVETDVIDNLVEGAGRLMMRLGSNLRFLQEGRVGVYLFAMVAGLLALLFFGLIL